MFAEEGWWLDSVLEWDTLLFLRVDGSGAAGFDCGGRLYWCSFAMKPLFIR